MQLVDVISVASRYTSGEIRNSGQAFGFDSLRKIYELGCDVVEPYAYILGYECGIGPHLEEAIGGGGSRYTLYPGRRKYFVDVPAHGDSSFTCV